MELKQLQRFLVVAETRNFHSASEILSISQPALSQSIQKLEDSVGELLFLRGPGGVELTEFGRLLLPRAKLIMKFGEDFMHEVGELQHRLATHIKVGVANYFVRNLFPDALARFAARMPEVLVDVVEDKSVDLIRAIEHGDLDLAFCGLGEEAASHSAVDFSHLYTERFSLFARAEHPIFLDGTEVLTRLGEFPWAIHDRTLNGEYFAQTFGRLSLPVPRFSVESQSLQVITSIVCRSDHIALIANDFVQPELEAGRIKAIEQTAIDITARGGVFTLKDAPKSGAVSGMIDALQQVCKERASS